VVEDAMGSATTTSTPLAQVDSLIQQVAEENGLDIMDQLAQAQSVPTGGLSTSTSTADRSHAEEDALTRRTEVYGRCAINALRKSTTNLDCKGFSTKIHNKTKVQASVSIRGDAVSFVSFRMGAYGSFISKECPALLPPVTRSDINYNTFTPSKRCKDNMFMN
ncbi:charged multivesicular body protein 1a, partial [Caerostris extrusa]